jgi:5,10-methylenetetrahydromethanopterin reductase
VQPLPSIGVVLPAHAPAETLPGYAARAEERGFDELWVIEDCFLSGGVVLEATALAATRELRVGIGLLPAAVRNPAIVAMEIATLARLHPGRVAIAFGHGVPSWMRQIDAHPRKRLAALEEVVSAVRALLRGETLSVEGTHVRLDDVVLENPPDVRPPILVGTTGPKGLQLAGRSADGILLAEGAGPAFVEWAVGQASDGAAGREHPPECVVYTWMRVDDDEERVRALLEPAVERWRSSGNYPEPVRLAPDDPLDLAVAGDPGSCARAIGRLAEAGAHSVVLVPVGDDLEEQLDRVAADVLPLLRA